MAAMFNRATSDCYREKMARWGHVRHMGVRQNVPHCIQTHISCLYIYHKQSYVANMPKAVPLLPYLCCMKAMTITSLAYNRQGNHHAPNCVGYLVQLAADVAPCPDVVLLLGLEHAERFGHTEAGCSCVYVSTPPQPTLATCNCHTNHTSGAMIPGGPAQPTVRLTESASFRYCNVDVCRLTTWCRAAWRPCCCPPQQRSPCHR